MKLPSYAMISIVLPLLSITLYLISLWSAYAPDYNSPPRIELVVYSGIDLIFSLLVFVFFTLYIRYRYKSAAIFFTVSDQDLKNLLLLFLAISPILFYLIYNKFLIILGGTTREELISSDSSRIMLIAVPMVTVGFPLFFVFCKKTIVTMFVFLLLIAVSIYSLSRAGFLIAMFMVMVVWFMRTENSGRNISKSNLIFWMVVFILISGLMTISQGRADTIFSGLNNAWDSFFKYRGFSFHLANRVVDLKDYNFSHALYPFFGFGYERVSSIFYDFSTPISVKGSTFVTDFVLLGSSRAYAANVLYPWWVWFYASFGYIGIIFKAIFCLFLLNIFFIFRMKISYFYFSFTILFGACIKHPFLNNDSLYFFISVMLIDLVLKIRIRKNSCHRLVR